MSTWQLSSLVDEGLSQLSPLIETHLSPRGEKPMIYSLPDGLAKS
ncbi:hypothetical protein HMPREF0454_02001 [Hafnia alvei ATCC 51873]|uniref:Uncharacterized protein n=1 Tax=Hafnia alvei ATCC 51873 TaxID=1002364 RepID=G9Y637_HAFAL|nr:hypothetical protein HMPREF0454_02001 [Hafnia alvei ATCC 51873]